MPDDEWYGEPHTLTVTSARPPAGPLDEGELEYEIGHPPSCKQEERDYGGVKALVWTCPVAEIASEGLPFALRYSGTPVTEPGTYRVQSWGRKAYYHEWGNYEYDGGIAVMEEDADGDCGSLPDSSRLPTLVSPSGSLRLREAMAVPGVVSTDA